MSDGIYIALNGAVAQADKLDVMANNLANASTAGFQRLRPVFREALAQAEGGKGTLQSAPTATTELDTTRGAFRVTGRALDVALPDAGYLAVSTARGERYTRDGSLVAGQDGVLRTRSGDAVLSEADAPIRGAKDRGEMSIAASGEVTQDGAVVGRLKVVTFTSPKDLRPEGGTTLAGCAASGAAKPMAGGLQVGTVEESNTSVVGSMTELVSASRAFDAFQRAIDAFHQADAKVTSTVPNADQ